MSFYSIRNRDNSALFKPIEKKFKFLVRKEVNEGKVIVPSLVSEVIDFSNDERKNFLISDFSLDNLIALGLADKLQPVTIDASSLSNTDLISNQIEMFGNENQ